MTQSTSNNFTLPFTNLAGWSAVLNGATSIISTVTIGVYFAIGGPWGTINDGNSVLWALTFLPIALLFYRLHQNQGPLNLIATLTGVVGLVGFAISQTMLTAGLVQFEQSFSFVLIMSGLVGVWLFIQSILARRIDVLPLRLVWLMLAFSLSFIIGAIGFLSGGWENPVAIAAFLIQALLGPIWAFWLAKVLLGSRSQPLRIS